MIAIALPFAIVDTIETGRVYVFSRQFLEELPQRFTGPGRFRFVMQPVIAIVLGICGGLADAKAGNPPYLLGLVLKAGRRSELLQSGAAAIRTFTSALNHGEILARPCNRRDGNHRRKHDHLSKQRESTRDE